MWLLNGSQTHTQTHTNMQYTHVYTETYSQTDKHTEGWKQKSLSTASISLMTLTTRQVRGVNFFELRSKRDTHSLQPTTNSLCLRNQEITLRTTRLFLLYSSFKTGNQKTQDCVCTNRCYDEAGFVVTNESQWLEKVLAKRWRPKNKVKNKLSRWSKLPPCWLTLFPIQRLKSLATFPHWKKNRRLQCTIVWKHDCVIKWVSGTSSSTYERVRVLAESQHKMRNANSSSFNWPTQILKTLN